MAFHEVFKYLLGGTGLGNGQRDAEDGVRAKLALVSAAVEAIEELVDLGLVLDVKAFLDQSRPNDCVDVLNGLGDALAAPLGLVAVAKLNSFVLACEDRLRLASAEMRGGIGTNR